jgi:hypothetical protein
MRLKHWIIVYVALNLVGLFWLLSRSDQRAPRKRSATVKKTLSHLNQAQCASCDQILAECSEPLQQWFYSERTENFSLHATTGYRGQKQQEASFQEGRSKAHFGESPHNYFPSRAVDLVFIVKGKNVWTPAEYEPVAKRAPANIEWGGYWKDFKDIPHFQERDWKEMVTNYPKGN